MTFNTITLDNGLRVIHLPSDSPVVYCGYQIGAGSCDEVPGEEGLAHFCEHVTFKGTYRHSAKQIINCLERVGGDLNAFTNKEDTCFYAAILKQHLWKAIDLLTDTVFHSTYPQEEIDKEVEVICDEIESYNDSPAELIYDEFENLLFMGHPLGHNILGTADRVRRFTTADALRFTRRFYRPDNTIFFISGDVSFAKVVNLLKKAMGAQSFNPLLSYDAATAHSPLQPIRRNVPKMPALQPSTIRRNRGTHQAHVMLGTRAYNATDSRRMSLYLLNNILGGPGMNARLNIVLREHHGLVYTVESSMTCYGDTGLWCIYFGCNPEDTTQCLKLIRKELNRYMRHPLSDRQLLAAKKQLKGQLGIAGDNRENLALDIGKGFLHHSREKDIDYLFRVIDDISAESMMRVAAELFTPDRMMTLIYD